MNDRIKLRDYQRECIDAVFQAWADDMRRPAVVLPTGAGKTVVFSELISQWRVRAEAGWQHGQRVMVLAHRDELVDQAIAKIKAVAPEGVSVGKVKAVNDDTHTDVMVCSVQTLASERRRSRLVADQECCGAVGLIITDECHHAAAESYGKVYAAFPGALQLGVTATLERGDGVGLGSVWDDVVYSRSVLWMISKGYLADVSTRAVHVDGLNLDGVKRSGGDYQVGALGTAMEESDTHDAIAQAYREHGGQRQGLVFTPTVATAELAAESLNGAGVRTAVISGETPREERQRIYDSFRRGETRMLSNCMVLTEGFDAPWASLAIIARPTQSAPLYTQMVGRVLRTWPGKTDALVLDMVGASRHRLRTLVDLAPGDVSELKNGETLAEAAIREAEELAEREHRRVPAGSIVFELRLKDIDMFSGSDVAWSRTPGGVLYVECGPQEKFDGASLRVLLWPSQDVGMWDVVTQVDRRTPPFARTSHTGLDLSSAMAWGEVVAEDHGSFSVKRSARWRSGPASDAQVALAQRLGIDTAGMGKGQVSDAISAVLASRALDMYVS